LAEKNSLAGTRLRLACAGQDEISEKRRIKKMKGYFVPFVAALVVCLAGFLLLDTAVMAMQGLSLIFQQ